MRLQQMNEINNLRLKGYGSTKIAALLGISPNTVKSHIRRHPELDGALFCLECGKPVPQDPKRKEKKFCCDKCRNTWWNHHQDRVNKKAYYSIVCQRCGKEFQSYGNRNRKDCSRDCYNAVRRSASLL